MVARRIPALDGLRGLAVLGVLLFHAGYLDGGFVGVDLFFVLSGFLITGLLLDDRRLGHFYARRARRLAPALLAMVLVVGLLAPVLLDDGVLADVRSSGVATLLYYANWHAISLDRDYFAALSGANPFEHTWSLAIEEQVYLAWPLLVLGALRLARRRRPAHDVVLGLAVGLAALSLVALALVYDGGSTARAYYGTDTRAFAVLVGAAVAAALRRPGVRAWVASSSLVTTISIAASLCITLLWIAADGTDTALYQGLLPAASVAGAVVVAVVAVRAPKALAVPPLVGLGLISYGLYLWHWPIYVVLDADRVGFGGVGLATVRIAVSLVVAVASYVVIERPVRFGMPSRRWRVVLPAAVGVAVVGLALGTAGAVDRPRGDAGTSASTGIDAPPDGRTRLLLLGDSQAFELGLRGSGPGFDRYQIANAAFLACGIGPGLAAADDVVVTYSLLGEACDTVLPTWVRAVDEFRPDVVLVHVGAWEVLDRRIGDRTVAFGTEEWDSVTSTRIGEVMDLLAGEGRRVVWLAAPCFRPGGASRDWPERLEPERAARWNELLRTEAAHHGDDVLPYDDLTCRGPGFDGDDFRPDGVHVTDESAPRAWDWIADQLTG